MRPKHVFEQSAGQRAFWLRDGTKLDTIRDLYRVIEDMDDELFSHHVNAEKNDFGRWIKDVFGEHKLAANVFNLSDKREIKKVMRDWVSYVIHEKHYQEQLEAENLRKAFVNAYEQGASVLVDDKKPAEENRETELQAESSFVEPIVKKEQSRQGAISKQYAISEHDQGKSLLAEIEESSGDNSGDDSAETEEEEETRTRAYVRNDLKELKKPMNYWSGIIDFALGFVLGTIAMLILGGMV